MGRCVLRGVSRSRRSGARRARPRDLSRGLATPLAALARRKDGDPKTALRFEAYVGGIELANAFDELIDPTEQRARFADDQRIRAERGKPVYPLDEKLLAALAEGLPPSAGVALGFDRLVMLATGAGTIADVLTFVGTEL
jgi:elongation factor P--(R)-beta-lysine ligase